MSIDALRNIVNVLQMAVILVCLARCIRGIRRHSRPMLTLFFFLGLVCLFVSDLYWVVHTWMGKGVYTPFSAIDVGICGLYLLLAAAIDVVFREKSGDARAAVIAAAGFAAANAALWIAWSGAVFQNILGGAAFVFLLCSAARALKRSDALSRREWTLLAAACAALIAVNIALLFHLSGSVYFAANLVNYVILFVSLAFFFTRSIRALRHRDTDTALALSFSTFTWNLIALYLSEEPYYTVSDFFVIVSIVLMYLAVRRKAAEI